MSDSIESIWEQGFLKSDNLVVPKINNLYERKSIHIIDKFKKMFRVNLWAIAISSVAILMITFIAKIPVIGVIVFVLLNTLVINGRRHMKSLEKINKTVSSYEYLKSFDSWIKNQITSYTTLYKYFYPLLFLGVVIGTYFSIYWDAIMSDLLIVFPTMSLIMGVPIFVLVIVSIVTAFLYIFGGALYRLDLDVVYGNIISKLDDIISDMEELRN